MNYTYTDTCKGESIRFNVELNVLRRTSLHILFQAEKKSQGFDYQTKNGHKTHLFDTIYLCNVQFTQTHIYSFCAVFDVYLLYTILWYFMGTLYIERTCIVIYVDTCMKLKSFFDCTKTIHTYTVKWLVIKFYLIFFPKILFNFSRIKHKERFSIILCMYYKECI